MSKLDDLMARTDAMHNALGFTSPRQEADIIRAVNAHDALVIALERCLAILNGQAVPSLREDTIANATAALILAHRET